MHIKSSEQMQNLATAVIIVTNVVGMGLFCGGMIAGRVRGWDALAISIIASGGTIFALGIAAGTKLVHRAHQLSY